MVLTITYEDLLLGLQFPTLRPTRTEAKIDELRIDRHIRLFKIKGPHHLLRLMLWAKVRLVVSLRKRNNEEGIKAYVCFVVRLAT